MPSLVEQGSTIQVSTDALEQAKRVTIKWSQSWSSRSEDYLVCAYTVKSGGDASGIIFIQASKLGALKSKKTSGEDYTFVVDDVFQYGQDNAKTRRFLVFHDKENKPYQHRFVENTITSLGGGATKIAGLLGFSAAGAINDQLGNFVGDYLRNW